MLPESLPILKELSLEMDMLNGWMPNIKYPIKLKYELSDDLYVPYDQVIYVGPRYVDSMELLCKYLPKYQPTQVDMMEAILKRQRQLKQFVRRPVAQPHHIHFDSDFESGNLDLALLKQNEYYLYMRCDSNSRKSHSWYYFSIIPECTLTVRLNICNFSKHLTLYQRGMKPFINQNGQWKQGGENVIYDTRGRLAFDIHLQRGQKVFIAYGVPYTYTNLLNFLQPYGFNILTKTAAGVEVPVLTFGAANRKTIIVAARVHPGESNSSFVMEGFLKYLTTPDAQYILSNSQVIAIPMLNPDGVIAGNFRTCLQGLDLNRQFQSPDPDISPQIFEIKKLIQKVRNASNHPPFIFLDLHGHSVKKNLFIYGPEYPIYSPNYLKCRVLAKLMSEATEIFRYWSGVWRVQPNKRSTARAILNSEYKICNCFTVECSNALYYLGSQQITKEFGIRDFVGLGMELAKQVSVLLKMDIQYEKYQIERLKNRKKRRINPYLNVMQQIKKDEEEHQIQEEDELIESQSSEDEPTKKKPIIHKLYRQSQLHQEIECRRSFVSEHKQRSVEKSVDRSHITQRPLSPYIQTSPFKRSVSSSRYTNKQVIKQRLSNYGFN